MNGKILLPGELVAAVRAAIAWIYECLKCYKLSLFNCFYV
jgi:hypothetical protein